MTRLQAHIASTEGETKVHIHPASDASVHTVLNANPDDHDAFCVADNLRLLGLPRMPGDLQRRRYTGKQLDKLVQFLNVKEPA